MFVRYVDKQGQPRTKFVDIVPLESATADGVCKPVTTSLETIDIDQETLKKKLVGCNFDGASVMIGKKSGVAVQIQKKVPQPVVILHCVAHNLELAVLDAVKTVPYLETFHETIRQVFKFYYYSPKKRRVSMLYQKSLMKIQLISAVTSRRQGCCLADIGLSLLWKKFFL